MAMWDSLETCILTRSTYYCTGSTVVVLPYQRLISSNKNKKYLPCRKFSKMFFFDAEMVEDYV
jgi:hypothetical protein